MTADGPAGLRILPKCGVNTTAWPCATLLASTWDEELVEKVGKAGAEEVKENNISICLHQPATFTEARSVAVTLSIILRIRTLQERQVQLW